MELGLRSRSTGSFYTHRHVGFRPAPLRFPLRSTRSGPQDSISEPAGLHQLISRHIAARMGAEETK